MIVGDPREFAIESKMTYPSPHIGQFALGFFVIYIANVRYGVYRDDASMLGVSFGAVEDRIAARGRHVASFATETATAIADAFREAVYSESPQESYFGIQLDAFSNLLDSNEIVMAPDGEETFDDSSYILQFDIGTQVRLVSFKACDSFPYDVDTLRDVYLSADKFYGVLQQWHDGFYAERSKMLNSHSPG